jgi:hypothetical protein
MYNRNVRKKHRKTLAKQHETHVVFDMGHPVALSKMVTRADGTFVVGSETQTEIPVAGYIETLFHRAKGPKIVHRLPLLPQRLARDPNVALTTYTWVLTVDTNQHRTSPDTPAFAGLSWTKVARNGPGEFAIRFFRESVVELHELTERPERVGWAVAIKSVVNLPIDVTVALIVDSELSRHDAISRRVEPVMADLYLPNQFTLVYASADVRNGYIANDLLKRCDRNAHEVAKMVAAAPPGTLPPLVFAQPNEPFRFTRVWNWTEHSPAA